MIKYLKEANFGRFFEVGSVARGEKDAKDYDMIVVPNNRNLDEWVGVLKKLRNCYVNGKQVDPQIIPDFNPDKIDKNKKYSRYVYSEENPNKELYENVGNKLWKKTTSLVNRKHKLKGIDKVPYIQKEL